MNNSRIAFHELLKQKTGLKNIYFQPPKNIGMVYPCIIYKHSSSDVLHADNGKYMNRKRYTVTIIDKNPDSIYKEKIDELPFSRFSTSFSVDGLNHFVYEIYE